MCDRAFPDRDGWFGEFYAESRPLLLAGTRQAPPLAPAGAGPSKASRAEPSVPPGTRSPALPGFLICATAPSGLFYAEQRSVHRGLFRPYPRLTPPR
jgi:hypothetical protein